MIPLTMPVVPDQLLTFNLTTVDSVKPSEDFLEFVIRDFGPYVVNTNIMYLSLFCGTSTDRPVMNLSISYVAYTTSEFSLATSYSPVSLYIS